MKIVKGSILTKGRLSCTGTVMSVRRGQVGTSIEFKFYKDRDRKKQIKRGIERKIRMQK